jgi:hypothetical protein
MSRQQKEKALSGGGFFVAVQKYYCKSSNYRGSSQK